ncbi:trypsin-like peptidase domain-containing protein [Pseudomonas reactans]|uniref:trypsin-like peptidase domain-containing protein n=1 Tax=Pseudomonas reactans TaxID=117680 RepID=UPI0015A41FDE|nr:trypsin-like peptidase domain-containing protein [Pseudomonas reactans]NWC85560.1 trypsin-like peptidase domain-containing protein [Pseudomonas reactans]NWD29583.1 trypsin-like peptidase domain-containing protein [Pseudomonas reactans]NWF14264.1 trypsin-like peptidase domain-containing protein [Pseudomonas reactans]
MNRPYSLLSCALLATLPLALWATPSDFGEGLANANPPRLLKNATRQHNHWSGVGRIRNDSLALCTATLLDTRDERGNSGPAYVITSSHCIHRVSGAVTKDLPLKGSITFNYFDDTLEKLKIYPLKTLKWGSSQGVDLALIELESPLAKLISDGIEPLKLADAVPADGTNILALSAPAWNTLHLSACIQQSSEEIVEQPFVWRATMKNQCQGIEPGAFGGPLLDRATNTLFGIVSTTTIGRDVEKKCQRDTPCEVKNGQASWHADSNYGSPVTFLNQCFVKGVLTADAQTCDLYPATSITVTNPEPIQQYFVKTAKDQGQSITPRWNVAFTTNTALYRYKVTRQARECESPVNYSVPLPSKDAVIRDVIGPQIGMHMLCILGVESDQGVSWNSMRNAVTLAVELADPATAREPDVKVVLDKHVLQNYTVLWHMAPPFINRVIYKYGPITETDCMMPEGYQPLPPTESDDLDEALDLYGMPPQNQAPDAPAEKYAQFISTHNQPIKVCTYAFDQADQRSTLREDLLKPR